MNKLTNKKSRYLTPLVTIEWLQVTHQLMDISGDAPDQPAEGEWDAKRRTSRYQKEEDEDFEEDEEIIEDIW